MQQVVLNLLLNARDAMVGVSGPALAVRLEAIRESSQAPSFVRLVVRDTGCGMSPETLRRVGEPFFTTKAPGHGTGLGLASAFHSIGESGGSWRVRSEPGEGTTFTIDLPLVQQTSRHAAIPQPAPPSGLHGTVLVVDDEPMVRSVLARQLTRAGMTAATADGANEALRMLRSGEVPDLAVILLDLSMPGIPGDQALPLIRDVAPHTPIIALSGHVPDTLSLPGVSGILQKPMGQRELVEAVRHAIDEAARRDG